MRSQMVLSAEDEEVLWWVLQRHAATVCALAAPNEDGDRGPFLEGEPCLNYDEYTQARQRNQERNEKPMLDVSTGCHPGRPGEQPAAMLHRKLRPASPQLLLRLLPAGRCRVPGSHRPRSRPVLSGLHLSEAGPRHRRARAGSRALPLLRGTVGTDTAGEQHPFPVGLPFCCC